MTESFEGLVGAAQAGTRKVAPERATDLALGEDAERTALLEIGALGLMRRAGTKGFAATPLAPAPRETRRVVDAADALEQALDEAVPAALEWAREAARRGVVAPPAVVSRLVPLAARHPDVRAVLGERGRWLAGVMGVEVEPEAPSLSEEPWEALDPKARQRLVAEGPGDQALFERALNDPRKEVREAAVERLVRMPNSPQARELARQANEAVKLHKGFLRGASLEASLPDPDGLPVWLPRANPYGGMGPATMALFDLVSHVPPSLWREPPDRMLDLARGLDEHTVLGLAWQAAADRFDDQAWLDAYLPRMKVESLPARSAVMERASEGAFEAAAQGWLRAGDRFLMGVVHAATLRDRPLSPELSGMIVEASVRAAGTGEPRRYDLEYRLPPLGRLLDPSLLARVEAGLGEPLAGVAEGWRRLLDLRRRLRESLR